MKFNFPWQSKKLQFPLVRIDDRLLHGQVVVGWGQQLPLSRFVLASDRLGRDAAYNSALENLIPRDMSATALSLSEAAKRWKQEEFTGQGTMVVLESTGDDTVTDIVRMDYWVRAGLARFSRESRPGFSGAGEGEARALSPRSSRVRID